MAHLTRSVGRLGVNLRPDVVTIQTLLNNCLHHLTPLRPLIVNGVADAATVFAIQEFQRRMLGMEQPDGLVEPHGRTLTMLTKFASPPRDTTMSITGVSLPSPAKRVLTEILEAAGLTSAHVTSVARTTADQARIMYEAIVATKDGLSYSYGLYGPAGDKVTKVYEQNRTKPRDEVIKLMEAKIVEVGPYHVSRHVSDNYYVIDVSPKSITNKAAFVKAAKAHKAVTTVLEPPKDRAFHIEVPKNSPYFKDAGR